MIVRLCCVIAVFGIISAQDSEDPAATTTAEPVPYICTICDCTDGFLDCTSRKLVHSFTTEEWDELKSMNIKEVNLSGNSIEMLTVISELPIETLNVSSNRIEMIDDWCFKYLENLSVLDLSRNELEDMNKRAFWGLLLPDSKIRPLSKMRHLSLAYNDLHVIPKDAFAFMHNLRYLDLSRNPLGIIDQVAMGTLTELPFLRELLLSGCGLETLPDGLFRSLRRLERLDISNNKFTTVPAALNDAISINYLNFDRNPITNLTERTAISSLIRLRELRFCNTRLQTIGPGALGGLASLETLYICNNPRLSTIDEEFLTWRDDDGTELWPALRRLYLHNNNISEIDPDFLFRWDQINDASFHDNPYVCDCNNQWMVDVLVPLITSINGSAADMICTKPPDVRGLSFQQLYDSSKTLVCAQPEEVVAPPGSHTAVVLGVLIALVPAAVSLVQDLSVSSAGKSGGTAWITHCCCAGGLIGIFATFPLVLVIVLLWKKGYFAKCRRKMNSDRDSDEENDAF